MYEHIINLERQQYWEYGDITCAGYPLKEIDTISETGEINTNSTLSLIVYGVSMDLIRQFSFSLFPPLSLSLPLVLSHYPLSLSLSVYTY